MRRFSFFIACSLLLAFLKVDRTDANSKTVVSIETLKSPYSDLLSLINPIAVPRVSGTVENRQVRDFIVSKLENSGWHVSLDTFVVRETPLGVRNFSNIIATQNNKANGNINLENRIVLACHYDSKYFEPEEQMDGFTGAIDSAVPCAMILDIVNYLKENVAPSHFERIENKLQLIFFDGEEPFKFWTDEDSIYGARNYATGLKKKYGRPSFDSIKLFLLLDLIGGEVGTFHNHYPNETGHLYEKLGSIESILRLRQLLNKKKPYFFNDQTAFGQLLQVSDDHLPFWKEGVPILHLITTPFPIQWHTTDDIVTNLDKNNIQDLRLIVKYFLLQQLDIGVSF